jgi:hypothetical protein
MVFPAAPKPEIPRRLAGKVAGYFKRGQRVRLLFAVVTVSGAIGAPLPGAAASLTDNSVLIGLHLRHEVL